MSLSQFSHLFRRFVPNPSWVLLVLAGLGLAVTGWSLSNVGDRTHRGVAVQNAMVLSESVRAFRSVYTREVIAKLADHGLSATHKADTHSGNFALPINLSLDFVNRVGSRFLESSADLYSPYPFEWETEPGLSDDFARRAWSQLSINPSTPVQEFEERDGRTFLRYATSDLMLESCVGCHNTYPGTPKTDWKAGDLRGVLEVTLPLDRQVVIAAGWGSESTLLFSLLVALFFSVAGLSVLSSRNSHKAALHETERHRVTSDELQDAIVERELAEKETRHLESQIQHAQKLESFNLMVGGLAHDFNNLLLPIVGNTEILRESADSDSASLEMLDEVELAATRASDLCAQMLTYAGKSGTTERVGVDLSTLLEETGRLLTASLKPSCRLKLDLSRDLPLIEADPVQISQIALNLIKNASEAIGEAEGIIRLRTGKTITPAYSTSLDRCPDNLEEDGFESPKGDCEHGVPTPGAFFEVADDGAGMDAETIGKIFDPFFTTKFTGRGLGLAAVQGIVRSHGGSIVIDSEPGSHTVIRVTFPQAGTPDFPVEPPRAKAFRPGEASGTILLAEDEPAVRAVAKRMLEDIGFQVVTADDGEDAIWRFSREPDRFAALFSDLTMPKMDGLQALRAMRKIRPGLPVILCSGYSEQIDELSDVEDSNTQFIRKPFRSRSLREKLFALLAARHPSTTIVEDAPTPHPSPAKASQDHFAKLLGPTLPTS